MISNLVEVVGARLYANKIDCFEVNNVLILIYEAARVETQT